ncbi:RICIN domain-containing protein [Streptomyces sp. NPDC001941]|uniref:RICIN domain-containing protein n=1 Tax=Streptomyces sp. NPDC001941 TaxID=3154659 RepID=UPI00332C5CFA
MGAYTVAVPSRRHSSMNGSTMSRLRTLALTACLAVAAVLGGPAAAQAAQPGPEAVPRTAAPTAGAPSGITARIQVKYGSRCLTIANGSLRQGAHAIEGTCDDTADHQVFTVVPHDKGGWVLVAKHSGRCLAHVASGTPDVVQNWCDGSAGQRWEMQFFDGSEKNLIRWHPLDAPGQCLSLGGAQPGEEPTAFVVDCFDNMPSQEWRLLFVH